MRIWMIVIGFIADIILGDPYEWPHPVKFMGNYIQAFLNKSKYKEKDSKTQWLYGLLLMASLLLITGVTTELLLYISKRIANILYLLVGSYLVYTCFSIRCLSQEAKKVVNQLNEYGVEAGRRQLAMIVGRDTNELSEKEIYQAVIETVAENTTDGFIAPLLYILLFGPIGGMLYKAINTLDSMVGYRYAPYTFIGRVSAKVDDIANYIPARMSYLLFILASYLLKLDWRAARYIGWRDKYNHLSPNSAWSEASVAGALGIQLGGGHFYKGNFVEKPTIGDPIHDIKQEDVRKTIKLMYATAIIMLVVGVLILKIGGFYG